MSLIQRSPNHDTTQRAGMGLSVSIVFGALLFLLTLRFGLPPGAPGLDPSWQEVLAWAHLERAQWGRDLIFTYGPTGFLYPTANYVDGIFWPFVFGQIVLAAGFALITAAMFYRSSFVLLCVFTLAFFGWNGLVPGEVSWPLTLLFGATLLVDVHARQSSIWFASTVAFLASIFAVIVWSKFSFFPLWLLCLASVSCVVALDRSARWGVAVCCMFVAAAFLLWLACIQQPGNIIDFLTNGFEVAAGYGHAMGIGALPTAELAGVGALIMLVFLCLTISWKNRARLPEFLISLLYAATALWAWRAHFTRGDHAPYFFASLSLLPFGLLCNKRLDCKNTARACLLLLCLACTAANLFLRSSASISVRAVQLFAQARDNLHNLAHLNELHAQRASEWNTAQRQAALPEIGRRIGNASVDMMGVEQGMILLNGWHYGPRPIFQSYSAFTPRLAQLNEAYYWGAKAPEFVILKLEPVDARLPASEDALALMALLRRYQPVVLEKGFLLLQREDSASAPPAEVPKTWSSAQLRHEVSVPDTAPNATVAFVKVDLTLLGRLYSLLLREPTLNIVLQTDAGARTYRFIRPTGVSGFVLSPLIQSVLDWTAIHLGMPVSRVRTFHVEAEVPWQNMLFDQSMQVAFEPLKIRHVESPAPRALLDGILPGFSDAPTAVHGISNFVTEKGDDALFLHAPGQIEFRPAPGRYRISARYGIREAALIDHNCVAAKPDGIGVSIVLQHANSGETLLLHRELDPFHLPADQGMHEFVTAEVALVAGDKVVYRVDPGHGGNNTACDWSYVRELKFGQNPL